MFAKTLIAAALALLAVPAFAQDDTAREVPATQAITIGQTHLLDYAAGDQRQINVYLPDGYDAGEDRFPVLYVIDGGLSQDFLHVAGATALNAMWGRSQPVIVVGIESKDRRAELIGSPGTAEQHEDYPTAGQSAQFRAFLRDRVKPLVEGHYRTNGDTGVIGESLAGLFIVETWLTQPDLFARYAAINPSLWWDDGALAKSATSILADGQMRGPILLTYSNEGPETEQGIRSIAEAVGEGACLMPRPDLTHATAYHVLTPTALQFLFPTEYEQDPEWGFEVPCSPKS